MLSKDRIAMAVSIFVGSILVGFIPAAEGQTIKPSTSVAMDGPYPEYGYSWENNDLGITDQVPKPWTAIQCTPNQLSVWGRDFQIGKGILPKQIVTQGKEIFARPPILTLKINDKIISLDRPTIHTKQDHRVTFSSSYTCHAFNVTANGSLEYDGLWKVQLNIKPLQGPIKINQYSLTLPLKSNVAESFSRYLDYDYLEQVVGLGDTANSYGELKKPVAFGFNPTVWVGNRHVGIEWICETDKGWSSQTAQDREQVIDIKPQEGETLMTIKVVSKPLRVKESYQMTFALYPTPVKPLPKDWRLKRLVSEVYLPGGFDTKALDVYSIIWPGVTPVKYPGLPIMEGSDPQEFQDPALQPKRRYTNPKKLLRETRQRIKEAGLKFIPYGALNFMPAHMPEGEWKHYASAWRTHQSTKKGGGKNRTWGRAQAIPKDGTLTILHVSPVAKSFHDFIVWQYVQAIEKEDIDGLYFDAAAPNVMAVNRNIPYAKQVRRGGKYYPFFAQRRLMQRLWVACKSRKEGFFITGHNPKMPAIISGFFDLSLTGEALAHSFRDGAALTPALVTKNPGSFKPDYSIFSKAIFSHGFPHEAIGTINMILPMIINGGNSQFMKDNPKLLEKYSRSLFARTLLYNIPLYAATIDMNLVQQVNTSLSNFDWLADATFFAPGESDQFLQNRDSKIQIGLYLNAQRNQVLMVASNLGKVTAQETLTLDIQALNHYGVVLSKTVEFTDPITQTVLDLKPGHGSVQVQVPANDFRMYIVR